MQHAKQGEQVAARDLSAKRCGVSDIVERIRSLRYVHVPVASQLFEEACAEIQRLRLTDAEREAIEWFVGFGADRPAKAVNITRTLMDRKRDGAAAATLRNLLQRTK